MKNLLLLIILLTILFLTADDISLWRFNGKWGLHSWIEGDYQHKVWETRNSNSISLSAMWV